MPATSQIDKVERTFDFLWPARSTFGDKVERVEQLLMWLMHVNLNMVTSTISIVYKPQCNAQVDGRRYTDQKTDKNHHHNN